MCKLSALKELLKCLSLLILLIVWTAGPSYASELPLEDWQEAFLAELKQLHDEGHSPSPLEFADYAIVLQGRSPEQLLQIVEERVTLRPYAGSMVDPAAALMGGSTNSLDRARLLAALLENAGYESRILFVPRQAGRASLMYPVRTPAPLQPISPHLLRTVVWQVHSLAPVIWQRICGLEGCADWKAILNDRQAESSLYWVQVSAKGNWQNLVPADTQLTETAIARAEVLSEEALAGLRWMISIVVTNSYVGDIQPQEILRVVLPAAELHGQPISYDNIPDPQLQTFLPTLAIGELPVREGTAFALAKQGKDIAYQQLHIEVTGPNEGRRYSRKLTTPMTAAIGFEMVTRGRITVSTSPLWEELVDDLLQRTYRRLANLIYAEPDEKDTRPLNLSSFRALSLLEMSHRLSGQVGTAAQHSMAYQGRPAIVLERDYAEKLNEEILLWSALDIVDPGHAFSCVDCLPMVPMRAAVEQTVVDGLLEEWITGGEQSQSSHRLVQELLASRARLSKQRPVSPLWSDSYTSGEAVYRLGTVAGAMAGWRLDPGPQVVPILSEGEGGTQSQVAASFTSSFVTSIIRNATTKCGASDIAGSVILSLAGAPMTAPLLSGIVGHQCRVAEAFNKAADALNCLEFMGNDCKGDPAKELENMLKGLGEALALDLAIAQAADIVFGSVIEGVISPAVKQALKNWGKRPPRGHMPAPGSVMPPGGSVMPPGGSVMPPGKQVMPPGGSVMPPGGSAMPPGGSAMPPGESAIPPGGSAMPPGESAIPPGGSVMPPGESAMPPPGGSAMPSGGSAMPPSGGSAMPPKVEEFGPGDLTPSKPNPPKVEEFGPGELTPAKPAPPKDLFDSSGRLLPQQPGMPQNYVDSMVRGKIPVGKGQAWIGVLENGRLVEGPYNMHKPGAPRRHIDMGKGESGKGVAFTVGREENGNIWVWGSQSADSVLTDSEKAALRKLVDPMD